MNWMSHFHMTYEGSSYTPRILSCSLDLFERDGAAKGHEPGEVVTLHLNVEAEPFIYDAPDDEDEHLPMMPGVDTQWLELPLSVFFDRDVRSLDGLSIVYDGPETHNSLTGERWRDTPGLLGTYGNQGFRRVRIDIAYRGDTRFAVRLVGQTEAGTQFDIDCEAPLGVSLTSYTGQAGEDRLRRWFTTFLRWDDFTWERSISERDSSDPVHSLKGTLKA